MAEHRVVDVIRIKRDGGPLTDDQIRWAIRAYTAGEIADEQMSALLMAVFLNGLSPAETATWTAAMIDSGTRLDLSGLSRPIVDKHSTGGVGDKISLILVPLLAACGAAVPQLSGRGLGHTGGTLDKMAAIPGWSPSLSPSEMVAQLESVGGVICAASDDLAPADRKLYALRDVTATVESIPLIAASIMSKKIAEGTPALVLDVKVGTGAFMKDAARAAVLAQAMIDLGAAHGVATTAVLSSMSVPLGRTAGNALEVAEAVEVLAGGGPDDVVELTLALAWEMLALARLDADPAAALRSGAAMDVWRDMVRGQGGNPDAELPRASEVVQVPAASDGLMVAMDALPVGVAAWRLGAGRARKEDPVDAAAGVVCLAKPGDRVWRGDPLFELHTNRPAVLDETTALVTSAVRFAGPGETTERWRPEPLVIDVLR